MGRITFQKRQKEMKRQEKQQRKAERRMERKLAKSVEASAENKDTARESSSPVTDTDAPSSSLDALE